LVPAFQSTEKLAAGCLKFRSEAAVPLGFNSVNLARDPVVIKRWKASTGAAPAVRLGM